MVLSLITALIGWGWAWVGIRSAVRTLEPGPLALLRYMLASLTMLPIWWMRGRRLPERRHVLSVLAMGVLGFTLYNLALNASEKSITAGTAALIGSSIPVMATVGARVFLRERLQTLAWLGVAISFMGVCVMTLNTGETLALSRGALLMVFASCCAAGFLLINKRLIRHYHALELTTWAIWAGTLGLLPYARSATQALAHVQGHTLFTVVMLGVFPGALCYTLWSFVLSRWDLGRVASWMFLIPVIAVLLGWLLLGELPHVSDLTGGLITLVGVMIVNTCRKQRLVLPASIGQG